VQPNLKPVVDCGQVFERDGDKRAVVLPICAGIPQYIVENDQQNQVGNFPESTPLGHEFPVTSVQV
jgi:hypothetical protein